MAQGIRQSVTRNQEHEEQKAQNCKLQASPVSLWKQLSRRILGSISPASPCVSASILLLVVEYALHATCQMRRCRRRTGQRVTG